MIVVRNPTVRVLTESGHLPTAGIRSSRKALRSEKLFDEESAHCSSLCIITMFDDKSYMK